MNAQLQKEQEKPTQKLDALRQQLDQLGQNDHKDLDAAQDAMNNAAHALSPQGANKQQALEAQGQAIENMQKGLHQLSENMRGQNNADEEGQKGSGRQGQGQQKYDPLGRSARNQGLNQNSPFDLSGPSPSQRAQDILKELRNRLSSPHRADDEINYLERLLKTY
jgi:Domain of unknown function (DUF4175)